MTRLVFETSDTEKDALAIKLQSLGKTFTQWFEEQLVTTIGIHDEKPTSILLSEISKPFELSNETIIGNEIANIDWSFSNEETGYLTHDIHPYPAKFIPQIPANLILRLSLPGELVLDPFGGSGTTATESVRLGRRAISIDANPISKIIGSVKTSALNRNEMLSLDRLTTALNTYLLDSQIPLNPKSFKKWIPDIHNADKWFSSLVLAELACIKKLIEELTFDAAKNLAYLALSKIVIRVSNQDSETRYVSKDKSIKPFFTIKAFLDSLIIIIKRVEQFQSFAKYGDALFICGDSRKEITDNISPNSVDLIVTSPPYPNATDYHLYHRFRIFWLGFDPKELAKIEIGSHLKHQKTNTGFDEFLNDITLVLSQSYVVLKPGRYAVFVVGDAIFEGKLYDTASRMSEIAESLGFVHVKTVTRKIHETKRSFSSAARRAREEKLLVLRKPDSQLVYDVIKSKYKLWPYEEKLRQIELASLFNNSLVTCNNESARLYLNHENRFLINKLTFASEYQCQSGTMEKTWQKMLENGDSDIAKRKDPKYVTHGIHAYKGKFYPQLAKSLINVSIKDTGAVVLDPFCGSGTVLLEGYLNGHMTYGCDMNPLAVKIAKAKTEILSINYNIVDQALSVLQESLKNCNIIFSDNTDQFPEDVLKDLFSWFPSKVVCKLNWLLTQIRLFGETRLVNFLEVIVSDCIRDVSQQDQADLRIRRRKEAINDAPVIELFLKKLEFQHNKLKQFWKVASKRPFEFLPVKIVEGDCRDITIFNDLSLMESSVDAVVTSPPYATALPYIDTDRLSLMAIMGVTSTIRKRLEESLTGSREINKKAKIKLEEQLLQENSINTLPLELVDSLKRIYHGNCTAGSGFRRLNMASLLWRYFTDMKENIQNIKFLLKPGSKAFYVVGDSKTKIGDEWFQIKTTEWLSLVAESVGLQSSTLLDISVTTENMKHIKNAITKNAVLVFEK